MLTKEQITSEYISNTKWDMRPVTDETGKEWSTQMLFNNLKEIWEFLGYKLLFAYPPDFSRKLYAYIEEDNKVRFSNWETTYENEKGRVRNPLEVIQAWYAEPEKQEEEPLKQWQWVRTDDGEVGVVGDWDEIRKSYRIIYGYENNSGFHTESERINYSPTIIPDPNLDAKLLERLKEKIPTEADIELYVEVFASEYGTQDAALAMSFFRKKVLENFASKPKTTTVTNDKGESKVISLEAWNNLTQSE